MKRCLQTLAISSAFLIVTSVVGYIARFIPLDFWWIFGIATGILVVGIVVSCAFGKRRRIKLISVFINAVAMGFYLRSWYINRGFDNPLWLMLCMALLASVYLLIFILPLYINAINRHYGWYLLAFTILSIAGYVCLVIFTITSWVSTLGYFGLLELGFIMTMSMDGKNKIKLYTSWQVASYTVIVCAVIILLIALGGDAIDGLLDGFSGDVGHSRGIASPVQVKPKDETVDSLPKI